MADLTASFIFFFLAEAGSTKRFRPFREICLAKKRFAEITDLQSIIAYLKQKCNLTK